MKATPEDILKRLISIKSSFVQSNKEIIEEIKNALKGFESNVFPFEIVDPIKDKNLVFYNLIVKIPGEGSTNPIVFVGHTDTISVCDGWSKNPFTPITRDGNIYGLGASDMKSGLACIIAAALSLDKKPKNDIYLLFDADEEGSGIGGKKMVNDFMIKNARVIIAEPTDTKIIYAQKGCLDVAVEVKGVALHSSLTNAENNRKNNAIYKVVEICNNLINYEKSIEQKQHPVLGKPSFNIGVINGGSAPNTVPSSCSFKISRRLIPGENIEQEFEKIKKIILSVDPNASVESTFWGEPYIANHQSSFVNLLQSLSYTQFGKSELGIQQAWTEAALFCLYGETLIFGPGLTSMCHKADEYVPIEHLVKFTEIYKKIMESS